MQQLREISGDRRGTRVAMTGSGTMLTDDQVITIVREYLEGQFPRDCTCCGRTFPSLREYLLTVTHVGEPVCWGLDRNEAEDPVQQPTADAMAFSNCPCGTTLTLGSENMSWWTQWRLLIWGGVARFKRGVTTGQLMAWVRGRVDEEILGPDRRAA